MSNNGPRKRIDRNVGHDGQANLATLLSLIGGGDKLAFKTLYDAVSPRLFGQAMKLMRSRDAAEDVLQETFLRVWASAGHFDPAYGLALAWLARITRNVAIDHLRRSRKAQRYFVPETEAPDVPIAPEPVEDRLDIEKALHTLPTSQRDAIRSVVVEGWTHEETALRGGIPVPTVKSQTQRGLKRLRSVLEHDGSDEGAPIESGLAAV